MTAPVYSSDVEIEEFIEAWDDLILSYIRNHKAALYNAALGWIRGESQPQDLCSFELLQYYCTKLAGKEGSFDLAVYYISEVALEDGVGALQA
ncbi:hypothetical protein ACYPKM_00435 [Pseudomonas aeruginosa]